MQLYIHIICINNKNKDEIPSCIKYKLNHFDGIQYRSFLRSTVEIVYNDVQETKEIRS